MAPDANEEPTPSMAATAMMPKAPDPDVTELPTALTAAADVILNAATCVAAAIADKEEAEFTETAAEAVAAPLGSKRAEAWAFNAAA